MKIGKKYLNKPCLIRWVDVLSTHRTTIKALLEDKTKNFECIGWVLRIEKDYLILCSERNSPPTENDLDLTYLPSALVYEITPLKKS